MNTALKAAAAVLLSLLITVGVIIFSDQITQFEELGYVGLFLVNLFGSATIILPAPAFVTVFALGSVYNPWLVGLVSGPAAALGELTGYLAGYGGAAPVMDKPLYRRFDRWMDRYGPLAIFCFALIPNPFFDVAGLLAGASRMPVWQFLVAAALGKTIRFVLLAWAGYYGLSWVGELFGQA
ncbi:MAG: VTT domain-containing protein [Anaerolineae bacterium]|nr:VTT domain-containing protein [Anaerolineae bacterium]